ncbi:unnamed protein product [Ceratitis capitata]|uniref:(Mediterranean fruit fly) hypothetical protein n=1 Tax=Ceratitis capitata TaxID=7213 RepID=A0A811UVS2_CERCA|nr:unnamed protein product [Ceratitis capitata]
MNSSEEKLKKLLVANAPWPTDSSSDTGTHTNHFRQWFLQQFNEAKSENLDDFAIYFLNTLRQQSEKYLRSNDTEQTCQTPIKTNKSIANNSEVVVCEKNIGNSTPQRLPFCAQNSAPSTPNFASTPQLDAKIISPWDSSIGEDLSANFRHNAKANSSAAFSTVQSMERSLTSTFKSDVSTPARRNQNSSRRSGNSSMMHATTPHSTEKSIRSNSATSGFCLGDFIVLQQNNSNRSNRKKTPQNSFQQAAAESTSETSTNSKPKKRVVPTTISNRTVGNSTGGELKVFGCNSSFSNENNILTLSHAEIEDKNKCSIMAARKSLKLNAVEISKELETVSVGDEEKMLHDMIKRKLQIVTNNVDNLDDETPKSTINAQLPAIELDKIDNHSYLERIADIYVVLMDLNFVTNILSEMAFVLNLLNTQEITLAALQNDTADSKNVKLSTEEEQQTIGMQLLDNVTNCLYFALCVLRRQRHLFAHLDIKSLGVVLHNERIHCLDMDLKSYLETIYQYKQSLLLDKSHTIEGTATIQRSFKNVYYQEDKDSRQHFTSNNEFGAFKTQRDLFYKVLKVWEIQHLNRNWNFSQELAMKIRDIFKQSENPINMAHFAKLFVAQLLISASDAASPEDIGLDIDAEKFSKLAQRLVAPSNFSVDYEFPRNQAFFRDFITEARSIPFIEQLKMALYSHLITLNNSTFEQTNLYMGDNRDADELVAVNEKGENSEFIVRPETLASMIILAKFLGFVTAYPYSQYLRNAPIAGSIEKKQLLLRSLFQPHFSISQHLLEAIRNNKMLITLPWLVQYLAMLDNITLQLPDVTETTQLLFTLYTQIGYNSSSMVLTPTTIFILRCCLGWLLDKKPIIAEKYFIYRATQKPMSKDNNHECQTEQQTLIVDLIMARQKEDYAGSSNNVVVMSNNKNLHHEKALNPILESLLTVACPFLAEFRVAIMPSKYATKKYVSRTGRYRHITTRIAESQPSAANSPAHRAHKPNSNALNSQKMQQNKIIDAFLQSQNASMRRLIEFISDRVYKSAVKDGQHKFILPAKSNADKLVNEIKTSNVDEVFKNLTNIYENAYEVACSQWELNIPKLVDERITMALSALLPTETTPIVQTIYSQLIRQNAMKRIQQWFNDNLQLSSFYCGNLSEITQKICKANRKEHQSSSTSVLEIVQFTPSVSDILDELQYFQHLTSLRTELLRADASDIVSFLQRIPSAFVNTLPTTFYRLIGAGIVQILQHLIKHKPTLLTADLMESACSVWLNQKFKAAINTVAAGRSMKPDNVNKNSNKEETVPKDGSDEESSSSTSVDIHKTPVFMTD